jgi:anti-anti-sigma factor
MKSRARSNPGRRANVFWYMRMLSVPAGQGLALLKIDGELDFAGAPAVRTELLRASAEHQVNWLVIDLADVTTADDKGIASLAAAVRSLAQRQPELRVVAVTRDRQLASALSLGKVPIYANGAAEVHFVDPKHAA